MRQYDRNAMVSQSPYMSQYDRNAMVSQSPYRPIPVLRSRYQEEIYISISNFSGCSCCSNSSYSSIVIAKEVGLILQQTAHSPSTSTSSISVDCRCIYQAAVST